MEKENSVPKKGEGRRQIFRISFLRNEHGDALAILNNCPQTLRGDLVAEAVVFYAKNTINQAIKGGDKTNILEEKPVISQPVDTNVEAGPSLTDLFNRVSL